MARDFAFKKNLEQGESLNDNTRRETDWKALALELQRKQPQEVDPNTVQVGDPFVSLWTIDDDLKNEIADSMRKTGYDANHPAFVWRREDKQDIVIDGHTRREAAILAGVKMLVVPVTFADEDEAYAYALRLQVNRRNLTDEQMLRYAIKNIGREIPGKGKRAARIADIFNVSTSTIKRVLVVARDGTPEQHEAVLSDKASVNQIFKQILQSKEPGQVPSTTDQPPTPTTTDVAPTAPPPSPQAQVNAPTGQDDEVVPPDETEPEQGNQGLVTPTNPNPEGTPPTMSPAGKERIDRLNEARAVVASFIESIPKSDRESVLDALRALNRAGELRIEIVEAFDETFPSIFNEGTQ